MKFTNRHFYPFLGACFALSAVVLGAFGAHALAEELTTRNSRPIWETAVHYQMWHALALLIISRLKLTQNHLSIIGGLFVIGSVLFSGSLYALALGGPGWLGPITPLGGLCLIIGWSVLVFSFYKTPPSRK